MFNTIQIRKSSQTPLYLQLANGLSTFIESSQLPSGTKLPSIRSLAKQLKINRDTVVSAYNILEQRGLAYGQTGRGTYVASLANPSVTSLPNLEPFSLAHKDLINFSSISIPDDFFSIEALKEMTYQLFSDNAWDTLCDYDGEKHKNLQKEICGYLKEYSIHTTPKQIHIIQSIGQLLQTLPRFAARPGICLESPSKDQALFKQYGFQIFEVPLNKDGLDLEVLENHLKTGRIQYIYVTPYLQNPTGICYSEDNKQKLLALAETYNVYIIENDVFSDLLLDGKDYRPLFSQSTYPNVIYIKHFSQLYMPRLYYSFVVIPNALTNINIKCHAYNFTDLLMSNFLHKKVWQVNKQGLTHSYHEKYLKLQQLIDLHLSPHISYSCALGGIYIWLTLETSHISLKDLCDELLLNHLLISPGSLFFSQSSEVPYMRLSIAKTSMAQIEKGIEIMASILFNSKFK